MASSSNPTEKFEVKGKVALVTGAASGSGLATTKLLLKEGAKVMMVDINDVDGEKSLTSLRGLHSPDCVSFTKVDVTDTEQLAKVYMRTKELYGGLDIVCNSAGIGNGEHIWRKMFEVNVFALIESVGLAIEHMSTAKGGKGGVVINIASTAGMTPTIVSFSKFSATKHAVVGYTRAQKDVSKTDGVRVNCVCPGMVDTPPMWEIIDNPPPEFTPEVIEFVKTHLVDTANIAKAALELISDTSKAGAAIAVTFERGTFYPDLLESLP